MNEEFLKECQKCLRNAIVCYFALNDSMDTVNIERVTEEIPDENGNVFVACVYLKRRDDK